MIGGFGGGNKSWGYDNVTLTNQYLGVFSYVTNDFITANGMVSGGSSHPAPTNHSGLIAHYDSGGGDFIYNSVTGRWELAGLNEATGSSLDLNFTPSGTGLVGTGHSHPLPPAHQERRMSRASRFSAYEQQLDSYIDGHLEASPALAIPEPGTWLLLGALGSAFNWSLEPHAVPPFPLASKEIDQLWSFPW